MAPACILLHRTVAICDNPLDALERGGGGGRAAGVVGGTTQAAIEAGVERYLRALKPDLQQFVAPPGVSFLTLVRPPASDPIPKYRQQVPSGFVAAADKNLVVLYVGSYRPGSSDKGHYLLFDAASSSLSTIPAVKCAPSSNYMYTGYAAVIVAREGGAFLLAELLLEFTHPRMPPSGMLCLWQGSEWAYRFGQLPDEVRFPWKVHISFYVQGKEKLFFCWVNLLHGLLLCDDIEALHFRTYLVPLPSDCFISQDEGLNPQDFRTMACVDGTIKFVTMDGFIEGTPISLVTYTLQDLDAPSPSWRKDAVIPLGDVCADDTFISTAASSKITPLFPKLSTQEHDIVYLVVPGKMDYEDGFLTWRAQNLLSVDTRKKQLIANYETSARTVLSSRYVLPFTASQLGLKYHQAQQLQVDNNGSETTSNNYTGQKTLRAVEAIGMGQVEKRMKFE